MIKAEIFEDRALLLDAHGRIWQISMGRDDQPEIRMMEKLPRDTVKGLMMPQLAAYVRTI